MKTVRLSYWGPITMVVILGWWVGGGSRRGGEKALKTPAVCLRESKIA